MDDVVKNVLDGLGDLLSSKWYLAFTAFFGALFLAGVGFGIHALVVGFHNVYGVTREVPWGILIAAYVFFAVTSTGLCLVSAIGHLFGVKNFMPIAKRAVFLSILMLLSGFLIIFFDIENPFRMAIYNVLSPGLTSNIWWMGTLYGICLVFMGIEFFFLIKGDTKWAMYSGLIAVIGEIAANTTLGGVFGTLHGREYWFGPYMSIFFITSAMMTGCAAIIFFTWWASKMDTAKMDGPMTTAMDSISKLGAALTAAVIVFTVWKVITGYLGSAGVNVATMAFLTGPYSANFWGFEVMLALVLPFIFWVVAKGKDMNLMVIASFIMLIGVFVMRYDMVLYGQIVPSFYELGVKEYSELLIIKPTFHEIMVVLAGVALTLTGFMAGEKIFQGHKSEIH